MASPSKDIHDRLIVVLKDVSGIKGVFSGVVPPVSDVKMYPSIAVDYASKTRKEGRVLNTMDTVEEIDLYVYHQQKANVFEDIMTPLCDSIDSAIQKDATLRELCISCYVSDVMSDGGILHAQGGRALYRLTVTCKYMERCTVS